MAMPKADGSGVTGVSFYKATGKWIVRIQANYKDYFLGYYEKIEDAIAVRKEAEAHLGDGFLDWVEEFQKNNRKLSKKYRKCAVCGELFWHPNKAVVTCSRNCEKENRSRKGKDGYAAQNLVLAQEAAKLSKNSGRFETNAVAKSWTIESPEGHVYEVNNLLLWAENHSELLPEGTSAKNFADGIRGIKYTFLGTGRKCTFQYKGWHLLAFYEENHARNGVEKKEDSTRQHRAERRSLEEWNALHREQQRRQYQKKKAKRGENEADG